MYDIGLQRRAHLPFWHARWQQTAPASSRQWEPETNKRKRVNQQIRHRMHAARSIYVHAYLRGHARGLTKRANLANAFLESESCAARRAFSFCKGKERDEFRCRKRARWASTWIVQLRTCRFIHAATNYAAGKHKRAWAALSFAS